MRSTAGRYERLQVEDEEVLAFIPYPLPPRNSKVSRPGQLSERLNAAEHALARLAFAVRMLPCPDLFRDAFARREAVLSSQLDGLQLDLMDLLRFEVMEDGAMDRTVVELRNHVMAWRHTRERLAREKERTFSLSLLDKAHHRLFSESEKPAGETGQIRRSQVWVRHKTSGQATYLPPPANRLPALLDDLEGYLHNQDKLPELVRIGLIQAQFENIHPYLAGNGRMARLLTMLLLEHWGFLEAPLFCLSLHFNRDCGNYTDRLAAIREEGDWEGWTAFFLDSLVTAADAAVTTLCDLQAIIVADRKKLLSSEGSALSAVRLFEHLPSHPVLTVARAMDLLQTTKPTAGRAIEVLADCGILKEITGRKRDRSFAYMAFVNCLASGADVEHD